MGHPAATRNRSRVPRAERGWSRAQLAERLDASRQTSNASGTGRSDPSLPLAIRMARLFAPPIEQIFPDGEDRLRGS